MKIVHPDKWLPCDGIILEEAANTAVRCSDRHVLVIAGPGAGKTELLAQKAAFLFQTNQCKEPQKMLAISFNKAIFYITFNTKVKLLIQHGLFKKHFQLLGKKLQISFFQHRLQCTAFDT